MKPAPAGPAGVFQVSGTLPEIPGSPFYKQLAVTICLCPPWGWFTLHA